MNIDYDHSQNLHTQGGPTAALPLIFADSKPKSLLDVGCGTGTWLKAAMDFGITDVIGVDGIAVDPQSLLIPATLCRRQDFNHTWNLGRRFDAALCLEVGEHLDAQFAANLVEALTLHADMVIFSAACPGQNGQHHVNCQWPDYWQHLFNQRGYACCDDVRWSMWADDRIEPWYRQNMFVARKDPASAGKEKRLAPVIHPAIARSMNANVYAACMRQIENGSMRLVWYFGNLQRVLGRRLRKLFTRADVSSRS